MDCREKDELTLEYVKKLSSLKYWVIFVACGFGRFSLRNNKIVKKSLSSVLLGVIILICTNLELVHIIYETAIVVHYLMVTELVILLELAVIVDIFVLHLNFDGKDEMPYLINRSIDIDIFLGKSETQFMRAIEDKCYDFLGMMMLAVIIFILTLMFFTFHVSMLLHVTASCFFFWLLAAFYNINFMLTHSIFLSLRVKYLNVALMKFFNMNIKYAPELFLFNGILWKEKHNDLVTFHKKAKQTEFVDGYKMIFQQMLSFQRCYRFLVLEMVLCITIGALLSVQTFIIYGQEGMDMFRKCVIIGWLIVSWIFLFSMVLQFYSFTRLIDQTKLICTFVQIKFITNEKIYRLTKSILRVLEIRDPRISIYGLFFFVPSMTLKMAASIFVYLTAQLQLTIRRRKEINVFFINETTSTDLPFGLEK